MSAGQGSINFTNNPASGGGGSVTGAINGLQLDGSNVVMGGPLDRNTDITFDGFNFQITDIANLNYFSINSTSILEYLEAPDGAYTSFSLLNNPTNPALLTETNNGANSSASIETRKGVSLSGLAQAVRLRSNHIGNIAQLFVDGQAGIVRTDVPFQTGILAGVGDNGNWSLGKLKAAAIAFDATQYLEVKVDGVLYKLALAN